MTDNNNIENIFREQFGQFEAQPSDTFWPKLRQKLFWKDFFRFGFDHFNAYYLSAIIVGVTIGLISLLKAPAPRQESPAENTTTQQGITTQPLNQSIVAAENPANTANKPAAAKEIKVTDKASKPFQQAEKSREQVNLAEQNEKPGETEQVQNITGQEQKQQKSENAALPVADYYLSPASGCVPLSVMMVSLSQYAVSFKWQFGDGSTSTEENPSHLYVQPGIYPVSLRVKNEFGDSYILKDTVKVYANPEAVFDFYPPVPKIPDEPVSFTDYSKNAVHYLWDFGDGHTSTDKDPIHYYSAAGEYNMMLTVWSAQGCMDTLVKEDAFGTNGGEIIFPNAFTPNPEGPSNGYYNPASVSNEVFHPICKGVMDYQLEIFSRNGVPLFKSNDIGYGWDGYINGTLAKQDVYVWKVQGRFANGKAFERYGNITLIWKKQ
jgi:PKD repeat protein